MRREIILILVYTFVIVSIDSAPPKQECSRGGNQEIDPRNDYWMHPDFSETPHTAKVKNLDELTSAYWRDLALKVVDEHNKRVENKNIAKNLILFLGDGLSIPTITATRSYISDDGDPLSFEKFPYTGMSKTYCVDRQVADSACTATAYLGGVKANFETIGVSARVPNQDCDLQKIPLNQVG